MIVRGALSENQETVTEVQGRRFSDQLLKPNMFAVQASVALLFYFKTYIGKTGEEMPVSGS